jgi:hypothetical protein
MLGWVEEGVEWNALHEVYDEWNDEEYDVENYSAPDDAAKVLAGYEAVVKCQEGHLHDEM